MPEIEAQTYFRATMIESMLQIIKPDPALTPAQIEQTCHAIVDAFLNTQDETHLLHLLELELQSLLAAKAESQGVQIQTQNRLITQTAQAIAAILAKTPRPL